MIEAMEDFYPVSDLCAAFDVSRAGFYSWRRRGPSERDRADATLGEEIGTLFARSRRTYGRVHGCTVPCAGRAMPVDVTGWRGSCASGA